MKVAQLIAELQKVDQNLDVLINYEPYPLFKSLDDCNVLTLKTDMRGGFKGNFLVVSEDQYKWGDEAKIVPLVDRFEPIVRNILIDLRLLGWHARVHNGMRTVAAQKDALKRGASTTLRSYHLVGKAVDIIDTRWGWDGDAANLIYKFWYDLGNIVVNKYAASRVTWGGIWAHRERWNIYEKAYLTKRPGLINWQCDVAHVQFEG